MQYWSTTGHNGRSAVTLTLVINTSFILGGQLQLTRSTPHSLSDGLLSGRTSFPKILRARRESKRNSRSSSSWTQCVIAVIAFISRLGSLGGKQAVSWTLTEEASWSLFTGVAWRELLKGKLLFYCVNSETVSIRALGCPLHFVWSCYDLTPHCKFRQRYSHMVTEGQPHGCKSSQAPLPTTSHTTTSTILTRPPATSAPATKPRKIEQASNEPTNQQTKE